MKLILVIFCVLAVYEAGAFICNSKKIARAFGAIGYCSQHVWIKPIDLEKNTQDKFGCQMCKDMNTAYHQLQNAQVQTAIKTYSANVCKLFTQSIRKVCLNFVDQQLIAKLTTYLNPVSCNYLLACQNSTESYYSNAMKESAKTFPTLFQPVNSKQGICSLCKVIVDEIRELLKSFSEEEFKEMLEYVCYFAGPLKSECSSFVDLFANKVYEEVTDLFENDKICANLRCFSKVDNIEKISDLATPFNLVKSMFFDENQEDSQCDTCQKIIGKVEEQAKNHASKEEIKKTLMQICPLVPPEQKSECENEINNLKDDELKDLLLEIVLIHNPKLVCAGIHVCSDSGAEILDLFKTLTNFQTKLSSSEGDGGLNRDVSMFFDENQENSQCDTCQKIIETVEQEVKNHASKEEIKKTLMQICPLVPPGQTSECENEINNLKDDELKDLLFGIVLIHNPKLVCAGIHVCSDSGAEILDLFKTLTNFQSKLSSSEGDGGLNRGVSMFFDKNSK